MPPSTDRDRFLEAQAAQLGEPIVCFCLAQAVTGPSLGAPLAFLMVGGRALHLVPAPAAPALFGIPLPERQTPPPPALSFPREEVVFGAVKQAPWWQLWKPTRDEIVVSAGASRWTFQLYSEARKFLADWQAAWGGSSAG